MSTIVEGRAYTLRFAIPDESAKSPGGVYATWSGKGESIKTGAHVPSLVEHQNWWFVKAKDSGSWHILGESPLMQEPTFGDQSSPLRLGFSHGTVKNGEPITLSEPKSYVVKSADKGLYTIVPASAADCAIGVSSNSEGSEIQIVGEETTLPKWAIEEI